MEARITFRSQVYIKGENLSEIRDKWYSLPLYSAEALEECSADFIEITSVEDAETYKDIESEFNDE